MNQKMGLFERVFRGSDEMFAKAESEVNKIVAEVGTDGKEWVEAHFVVETDIEKLGDRMIESIEAKRQALGI